MVWFKVSDEFDVHHKVLAAGDSAIGLWVRCGAYASRLLTDGFVPTAVAIMYAGGEVSKIDHLVTAGLWEVVDGGFRMHDFTEYNPTRDDAYAERRRKADNQKAYAERKRLERENRMITREPDRSDDRPQADHVPTRPDPTRSTTETSNEVSGRAHSARTTKRAMPLPNDWAPTDTHLAYGAQHHIDVVREAEKFRNHHQLKGTLGKDWNAGFRNWLIKAVEYRDERVPVAAPTRRKEIL